MRDKLQSFIDMITFKRTIAMSRASEIYYGVAAWMGIILLIITIYELWVII